MLDKEKGVLELRLICDFLLGLGLGLGLATEGLGLGLDTRTWTGVFSLPQQIIKTD